MSYPIIVAPTAAMTLAPRPYSPFVIRADVLTLTDLSWPPGLGPDPKTAERKAIPATVAGV